MKKSKILVLFIIVLFILSPLSAQTSEQNQSSHRIRQAIEILKFEISLLQMLISNWQSEQAVNAASYLAVNLSDNSVLLEKNTNQTYPIASITKLMSAVITLESIDQKEKITLTEEMLKPHGQSPTLYLGLNISVDKLLKASLIQSSNDASEAISHFPGKNNFVALMNQKGKELGMTDTVFYDSHGLNPLNRSTASDLVKLIAYIHKNHPEILQISRENDFWLPDETEALLKFRNVNNFYPLHNFVGGKTGYLPEARQTLASVFEIDNQPIAIIVLYSRNRQADTFGIIKKLR